MSPQPPSPSNRAASASDASAHSAASASSPIRAAHALGQSIWLDNISRELLLSGELRRWVEQEGIRGVTSNPAIFEKAIAKTGDYDPSTRALVAQGEGDALDIFERLAVADIQLGCDVLRPIWEESGGHDGFVSLEVSPYLAHDTEGTIAEARRLSAAVSRDNLMIKVPATPEGIPAIQALIADGIHVNVTLLFAVDAYEAVHQAYLAGLETRLARGQPVSRIASVASFFISRIDAAVGQQIESLLETETREAQRERLRALDASVAIANAKLAYGRFLETLASERWARLVDAGGTSPERSLGEHRNQGSRASEDALRRRADRSAHGQHAPGRHARSVPPAGAGPRCVGRRPGAIEARGPGRPFRARRGGHLAQGDHGRTADQGVRAVRGRVRGAAALRRNETTGTPRRPLVVDPVRARGE